jgi:hypothetical protein
MRMPRDWRCCCASRWAWSMNSRAVTLTTVDNTRLLAASLIGTPVQATIFNASAAIEESQAVRFIGANGELPSTWGEAVSNRIGNQNFLYRTANPTGSWATGLGSW